MSHELIAVIFTALALALIVLGMHIGLALGIAGAFGILAITGSFDAMVGVLKTTSFHAVGTYAIIIVPLFVLMGMFSLHGGISGQAYRALSNWIGRLPGGLSLATTWACTAFGATSGSYIAAGSVFTKISLPEMRKAGYDKGFACGGIATAAIIAMVIPPSLFFVIYGMLAEESIARLLIAGIFPGLIMAMTLSVGIWIRAKSNPRLAPVATTRVSWREKFISTRKAWPMVVLAAIILGGIYTGVFTPTEAAAIGAFVALIITLGFRKLSWDKLKSSLLETVELTTMLALLFIGATVFARFLAVSRVTAWLAEAIIGIGLSPLQFVIVIVVLYLILGCFVDAISAMFVTMPLFFPVVIALGINPIWFGVLTVVSLVIGAITPPFGLSVYTVKAAAGPDVTVEGVFRGAMPYYLSMLATLAILVAFPQISTFLPNMMMAR
ncbi:MAG: TRAP transporter large permease [Chloroflexota bacterium]